MMIKTVVRHGLGFLGYELNRIRLDCAETVPVEFDKEDVEIVQYVRSKQLSMVSTQRLCATISACKHAAKNEIDGDFVECGVWRGGNALAAKMTFERLRSNKHVFLFDTFAGMTKPGEADTTAYFSRSTFDRYLDSQKDGYNEWCYASLEDVKRSFEISKVQLAGVRFVPGDVLKTLKDDNNLPNTISVLRLDTDWYESTKLELEVLYPRVTMGGSLLIDDYGHWDGARKAVDEYFERNDTPIRPLLHYTDATGRMGVKVQ